MKYFLILISIFFLKTHVCFSSLDYEEVAQYIRSSQISFSGQRVDFSDIHSDMAVIESMHHSALPSSDKGKNICLVRLTPVYEITNGSSVTYQKDTPYHEIKVFQSTQREAVFFSSFDPSSDLKGKIHIDNRNFYFCNSKVEHEDDYGRCFCSVYRWAGSLHLLKDELNRKRSTQLDIGAKWCHVLKVADKISSLNATVDTLEQSITTLPGINPFSLGSDLPIYLTRITDSLQRGCKEMSTDFLNLACSEQNSFNYLRGMSAEPLSIKYLRHFTDGVTPDPQRILKSIVFHMHTTKHPCHMCGFSACIEFLEHTPEFITLKDDLVRSGFISTDFRIVVLCSYRYTYELKDRSELPNVPAITYADHLEFDNPANVSRIGLFKLRQRFVTDL